MKYKKTDTTNSTDVDAATEQFSEHIEQEHQTRIEPSANTESNEPDTSEQTGPVSTSVSAPAQPSEPVDSNQEQDEHQPVKLTGKIITPIPPGDFPDTTLDARGKPAPLSTIANLAFLIVFYGIEVRYDVIGKKIVIIIPGLKGCPDNAEAAAWATLISLAKLNRIATGPLADYIIAVANTHLYNPVADWIQIKPWDGEDRLKALYQTLSVRSDFPEPLRDTLVRRWLISSVAAAVMVSGFGSRGVLVLQGPQSIGKTRWVMALVPDQTLQEQFIKIDHHLDASDKDTKLTALRHWIVEIGELDSSFKKDVARLKGFITGTKDKIRVPYARTDSEYSRRTVFCATVNMDDFLIDSTGNTRWWTIPVTDIDYDHDIDMQQVFAQVHTLFEADEKWWLTKEEEALLEQCNKDHQATSTIRDMLESSLDFTQKASWKKAPVLSATHILQAIGIQTPTNPQAKECAAVLRGHLGEPVRSNGTRGWRVAFPTQKDIVSVY